jgi:hypothetical protein
MLVTKRFARMQVFLNGEDIGEGEVELSEVDGFIDIRISARPPKAAPTEPRALICSEDAT